MKHSKILALLLSVILVLSLVACDGKKPAETPGGNGGDTPPSDKTSQYELADYSIIYSNQLSNRTADAITSLASKLSDGLGGEFIPAIDRITQETEKEILIGGTDRPESAEVLSLITDDNTFIIKTVGNKIVINAKSDTVLITGVSYFTKLVAEKGYGLDEMQYISDPVKTLDVIKDGKSDYSIIHLDGLDTNLKDGNAKYDLEVKLCYDLQKAINDKASINLSVKSDSAANDYEILIGQTTREETTSFFNSLRFNEYGYEIIGNKIVIMGTNATTTKLAVNLFIESVKEFTKNNSLVLCEGMRITRRSTAWNLDFPAYEGGTFGGTLDSALKGFTVLYKNTNADEFEAYCKKLEAEGYTLWQRHDIEDNLHATYTHETRGMIHTYFTANEESVRIISYKKGNYKLPTNNEKYSYDVVAKTSVTQFGLYGNGAVGMCFVITLEDGSFILVDSGTNNDDKTLHHDLYELLKDLNKRPDGKIVIKAWYLTHEHGDHYYMFSDFIKEYGKKVTIEEFWCNPVTTDFAYNGSISTIAWEKNYTKNKGYINGDFKWINLHTGMEFYAANMKFEVLYTEEDLFPKVCQSYNNCILILKMTDIRSGQTMLFMGDLLKVGCETLAENYDGYLKSDILQVAHHGKSEALPVYQEVIPTVAFWPCSSYSTSGQYGPTNKFVRDTASVHINAGSTNTIKLPFKKGDPIEQWQH